MGFLDEAKKKLTDVVDKHGDKIDGAIDKAADFADKKSGGKHGDKITDGAAKLKDTLGGLDGKKGDDRK